MPNTVRVTSPGHPVAITTYVAGGFGGFLPLMGLADAKAMTALFGSQFVATWGAIAFVAGLIVASVAFLSRFQPVSQGLLRVEYVTLVVLAICWMTYEVTLVAGNGFNQVLFTQNWVTFPAIGFAWRGVEAILEVRRVRRGPRVGD